MRADRSDAQRNLRKKKQLSPAWGLPLLAGLLLLLVLFAVSVGSSRLSIKGSFEILSSRIPLLKHVTDASAWAENYHSIVFKLRLPRILTALMAGAGLSLTGAVFQSVFRNNLADPHILGISSGAAFGATLALVLGLGEGRLGLGPMGISAFLFALLTIWVVYHAAGGMRGESAVSTMLLVGVALNTLLASVISILMLFHHDQIAKVYMWTLGSFASSNWDKVRFLAILFLPSVLYLLTQGRTLNLLLSGDEEAMSLGLDIAGARKRLIFVSGLLISAIVSVSGIVGFVGLIVPQYLRMIRIRDLREQLPYTLLCGAIFVLLCDTAARTLLAPTDIPVGIITSIFGVPYFLSVLFWQRRKGGI